MIHAERAHVARLVPRLVALVRATCLACVICGALAHDADGKPRHRTRPRSPVLPSEGPAPRFDLPIVGAPLDTPLVVTGGFGEYRIGHFHAAYDFSTGGATGKRVYAPMAGHIERIRTSGVGYGRSLYLRTEDGRTLQFGHLDAFGEPIASWVRAIQDSTGQYEQDLWLEASRFPIALGQPIAWSGQSGAGGPHLHFEIRRGDMAYQPMRAGLEVRDRSAPILTSLTLEPLDDTSYVERGAAPYTLRLGATPETLTAIGRVRAVVGARDGAWQGVDRMVPWLTRMEWDGQWIEARFDSVSWATDMPEGDYVYDTGRVVGEKGLVLWSPPGWRPRVIRTSVPLAQEAGTIVMRPGDTPKTLTVSARDAAGNRTETKVVVRAPRPGQGGPDPARVSSVTHPRTGDERYAFAALPGSYLRVTYRGADAGVRGVRLAIDDVERPASPAPGGWTAVIPLRGWAGMTNADSVTARGYASDGQLKRDVPQSAVITLAPYNETFTEGPASWNAPMSSRFDSSLVVALSWDGRLPPVGELVEGVKCFYLGPESEPLRGSVRLRSLDCGDARCGWYRLGTEGWEWLGRKVERDECVADSRHLGWFAVFSDTLAPRIGAPGSAGSKGGPYPRWAIEAPIEERGSGLDARASCIEWDGKREPSEWDPEAGVLRWRPAARPSAGEHRIEVVASDKAGNARRRSATLVLD